MVALNKLIKNTEDIVCGIPLSSAAIKLYRRKLADNGFPPLPDDYWEIISEFNGLYYNDTVIYGLSPQTALIRDLLEVNLNADWSDEANAVMLGENDTDILLYDGNREEFMIIDKDDETVWKHSADAASSIASLLQL